MTDKLKQTIKEEIEKLPKEAQEAINSLDWVSMAEEIGKKHLLTESEINDFQVETLLVLVGIESGYSYALNIENEVGTSKNNAEKIAEEANQKIFTLIYSVLEENIKKNLPSRRITPEQNLNFILSGGDYMTFLESGRENPLLLEKEGAATATAGQGGGNSKITTSLRPQVGALLLHKEEKRATPSAPRKMTDIHPVVKPPQDSTSGVKSKFTI